jgi:peptide deformylase
MPSAGVDAEAWSRTTANELVRGAAADAVNAQVEDTVEVLAEQLVGVASAVQGTGIAALETAVSRTIGAMQVL